MDDMNTQLDQYETIEKIHDFVSSLDKSENTFIIKTKANTYKSKKVIVATGLQKFNIDTSLIKPNTHTKITRKGKVMLENDNGVISENLYVSGVAAGHQTMFAIASGDGVKIACEILEDWGGDFFVPHYNAKK